MRFCECERLLNPAPLQIETGVERLESGGLHIAVNSILEHCTADMLEHWFAFGCNSDEYRLWHPGAHIYSEWIKRDEWKEGCETVAGLTHKAVEMMAGHPAEAMLAYIDPFELFGDKLKIARAEGNADVVLYAEAAIGKWDEMQFDDRGRPVGAQYVGVGRNTPYGLVLRNHYWMGDTLPFPKEQIEQMFPLELGMAVMNHDMNEFHILGKVMPSYYLRDKWEELGAPEPFAKTKPWGPKATPNSLA